MNMDHRLPRSQPEEQGIHSAAIASFLDSIKEDRLELHSFMLLRHGHIVAEGWWNPYEAQLPHMLYSLSKSFTSAAIGLAVAEGILTLDDQVVSYFPEDLPNEVSGNLSAMQIRHLLMMGTGHAKDTMDLLRQQEDGNWAKAFLQAPVEFTPGTHFLYNTGATYMLSAILQKVTGEKLLDYLQPRLLDPLGIANATWETCPQGVNTGGFGLNITTEDIAKFGQLYLQQGSWNGSQLLSASWIAEATSKQISNGDGGDNDWTQGYGYQFWMCRHDAYRGDGAFGQNCIVLPDRDAVIVTTAGVNDLQAVLNKVWRFLLPAMDSHKIPLNQQALALLESQLKALKLIPVQIQSQSPKEALISGAVYRLEENIIKAETLSLRFEQEEPTMIITNPCGEHVIRMGRGEWMTGNSRINQGIEQRIASSFTWRDNDTLEITLQLLETPFCETILCRWQDTDIVVERSINVSFGPAQSPPIRGKLI
jgi:CubicO group peptidase (beta-lactamase class C family)